MKPANGTTTGQSSPPINVLLMLRDHLPRRHREVEGEIRTHEQATTDLRAELSRLEKHAAIEGIPLSGPREPQLLQEPQDLHDPETESAAA